MMATNRSFIKDWVPPAIWRTLRRIAGSPASFRGNYKSWEEARAHSTGYDSAQIVSRVLSATLAVKRGEACFERDSVLFDQPAPPLSRDCRAANMRTGSTRPPGRARFRRRARKPLFSAALVLFESRSGTMGCS